MTIMSKMSKRKKSCDECGEPLSEDLVKKIAERESLIKGLPWDVPKNLDSDAFLLLGDPNKSTQTWLGRYWLPVTIGFTGFMWPIFANAVKSRPLRTAFHRTILSGLFCTAVGEWMYWTKESYNAERDIQYFHYICLHPEDFAPKKRVKYRDYLESWVPIR